MEGEDGPDDAFVGSGVEEVREVVMERDGFEDGKVGDG